MSNPKIVLGQLQLANPVMNSSGPWAATIPQLEKLHHSQSAAVVTKTFTLGPREGNPEPNQYFHSDFSINSVGLANQGATYFCQFMRTLKKRKPIIASIYESNITSFTELALESQAAGFDALELNVSCPNIQTNEPIAYNCKTLDQLLRSMFNKVKIPVSLKLPPFTTRQQIKQIAESFKEYPINHLVLINTFPLAMAYAGQANVIASYDGIGGLGGTYLKPMALAHVSLFKQTLPHMPVVGVGGITTQQDIQDYIAAGASAIQVGSFLKTNVNSINQLTA